MPTGTALGCVQCPPTRMLSAPTMTAQRQERNGWASLAGFRPGIAVIQRRASPVRAGVWAGSVWIRLAWIGLVGTAFGAQLPHPAEAATTEPVIVNRFTGLAIEGFDPVAYFADARALAGLPAFEVSESGAVW